MHNAGKIGFCLECVPLARPEDFKFLAITSVCQFLKYFDMVESDVAYSTDAKRIIRVEAAIAEFMAHRMERNLSVEQVITLSFRAPRRSSEQ